MTDKRQIVPLAGLAATMFIAIYMVVQLKGQNAGAISADLTTAAIAEVKDAQGAVVLQGSFEPEEGDGEVERKAILKPVMDGGQPGGDAEVEFAGPGATLQEVEFSVRGLAPGATFTFVIDGHVVATATADTRGRAEAEVDVRMPGPAPSR